MFENIKKNDELILRIVIGHRSSRKYEKIVIKSVSAGGKISVERYGEILKFDQNGNHKNRPDYSSHYYTLLPDNEEIQKEIAEYNQRKELENKIRFLENFRDWKRLDESVINTIIAAIQQQEKQESKNNE